MPLNPSTDELKQSWNRFLKEEIVDKHSYDPEVLKGLQHSFEKFMNGGKELSTMDKIAKIWHSIIEKSQPTSAMVHVPAAGEEQRVRKTRLSPTMSAGQLHAQMFSDKAGMVGGTVRDGSEGETFHFGPLSFDIDKAREIAQKRSNGTVEVTPDWSEQINVDRDAAMKGVSENPVFIAELDTENGPHPLLIDGHHRMYRAFMQGETELPAYIFTPEETEQILMNVAKEDLEDLTPEVNNQGAEVRKDNEQGEISLMQNMQAVVEGMDWEMAHGETDPNLARELAIEALIDDPLFYKKLQYGEDRTGDELAKKDTGETESDPYAGMGLNIDLGSGQEREPGYIGFDLYPHDHGTVVHDLHQGIPLPDKCVSKVRMINSLHHMDDLSKDPKPLLSEISRVLQPGGQFVYQGPGEVYNQPQWTQDLPGLVLVDHEDNDSQVNKIEGNPKLVKQTFQRVATPDPATANDAEPRIGIAQYDMLPADALLAMDAVGYFNSDATSSGRGNRLNGYPSQGALVDKKDKAKKNMGGSGASSATESNKLTREGPLFKNKKVAKIMKSDHEVSIMKADQKKQVVYGVVLAPDEVDSQEDWMTPDDIEEAAHYYMKNSPMIGKIHKHQIKAKPVESFIAPQDFDMNDPKYGNQKITKGSWVLGVHVEDPKEWEKVENGEYTGFSVGGMGERVP